MLGCGDITVNHEVEMDEVPAATGASVHENIARVERRSARNMEASNAAIASHIGALSERMSRVEKEQEHAIQKQIQRSPRGGSANYEKGAQGSDHEEYCAYSEFIATTQTNLNCVGVHAWSLCTATRRTASRGRACAALLPSAALLAFQCFVLLTVGLGSLHPTCVRNEDCRAGMWCAPSAGPGGHSRAPGMCDDCEWASKLSEQNYGGLPSRYNEDTYAAMTKSGLAVSETLATAVVHCDATDTEPDRCDFLVDFRNQLTLGPLLVLLFVTTLVLVSLVADMDRQSQVSDVFVHRLAHVAASGHSMSVASGASLIFTLRRFVLPGLASYAYATLVLTGPTTQGRSLPLSFVLSGLVVGFVYNIDRLLALTLLSENAHAFVREAFADVEAQKGPLSVPWLPCFLHRLFATCLGCLIVVEVVAAETIMDAVPLFRLDWDALPARWVSNPSPTSCTNVVTMLGTTTLAMVVIFTLVWSISCALFPKKSPFSAAISPVSVLSYTPVPVALLTVPLLSYLVLHVSYAPVA